ncbi:hypothetical protein DL96DRAFT_1532197 [Flagelloscypha sp. PMI_526]|nr:hypothetical protein DL96DRAFT_1532197 [Flagelloscypha sp. PMI_526]
MVAFKSSLFFLASTIVSTNALPTPYSARSLQARRPAVGQSITLSKTINNVATGTFTTTGGPVTFTMAGKPLGGGSAGDVFPVNCGSNAACTALGPVVLKFYTDTSQVADEQQHLAKIGELKAVSTGAGDKLTLMKGFTGKKLDETDAYLALTDKVTDKTKLDIPAITKLVNDAATLAEKSGFDYLIQHQILHLDINGGNVLFTESGGKITTGQLIDWDKAAIIPAAQIAETKAEVTRQKINFNRFFETPATQKREADAEAARKAKAVTAKKAAPRPGAAAAAARPAARPATGPAAARPVVAPRPGAQPAVPPPPAARLPTPPGQKN